VSNRTHERIVATRVLLSSVFLCFTAAAINAEPYFPSEDGNFIIEAEHYDAKQARGDRQWVLDLTPGFIGDGAMRASPNSWKSVKSDIASNSPRMDYEVSLTEPTTFKVWIRGLGPSGSADSVWIGIDGDDSNVVQSDPTRGDWGWKVASRSIVIPAGIHTINIWMREDGTIIDRIYLSPSTAPPTGDGGSESSRGQNDLGGSGSVENTWPVAYNDEFSVVNDGTSHWLPVLADNGSGADFDPDGDDISLSAVGDPSNPDSIAVIDSTSDGVFFTPGSDTAQTETFDYTILDGNGGSGTATVSVSVASPSSESHSKDGDVFQANNSGEVVIEAENYFRNVRQDEREWVADFTAGFVGDSAMRASPNSWRSVENDLSARSPRMDYLVAFETPTSVNVWVRGLGPSGSADSIWVGIDENENEAIRIDPTRGAWGWEKSHLKLQVPTGIHTINVWMREDGTIIDRLLLSPSSTAPTGAGPVESMRYANLSVEFPPSSNTPTNNNSPVISGAPLNRIGVGEYYNFTPSSSDTDGQVLSFSVSGLPAWLAFDTSTGRLFGTPNVTHVGDHRNITISASDGMTSTSLGPFSIAVVAQAIGSATLSWTAPSQNEDGSPVTNLAGYKLYWGTTVGTYPNSVTINDPTASAYTVRNLNAGTYHFVSTSFNSAGVESSHSNRATKTIQ